MDLFLRWNIIWCKYKALEAYKTSSLGLKHMKWVMLTFEGTEIRKWGKNMEAPAACGSSEQHGCKNLLSKNLAQNSPALHHTF